MTKHTQRPEAIIIHEARKLQAAYKLSISSLNAQNLINQTTDDTKIDFQAVLSQLDIPAEKKEACFNSFQSLILVTAFHQPNNHRFFIQYEQEDTNFTSFESEISTYFSPNHACTATPASYFSDPTDSFETDGELSPYLMYASSSIPSGSTEEEDDDRSLTESPIHFIRESDASETQEADNPLLQPFM